MRRRTAPGRRRRTGAGTSIDRGTILAYLVHLGYLFMLAALLAKDMLWLRGLLVVAQGALCAYAASRQLSGMAAWNAAFVLINLGWALAIVRERRAATMPEALQPLYESHFAAMGPREFLRFWSLGERREVPAGARLVPQGVHPHDLLFLIRGQARVLRGGMELARLPPGSFVAEMSLLTGQRTSADVDAVDAVELMAWPARRVQAIRDGRPGLWIKLQSVLGLDMVEKLKRAAPAAASQPALEIDGSSASRVTF